MIKEKSLLNYCGLLGVAAFLSYTAVLCFHRSHIRAMTGWHRR